MFIQYLLIGVLVQIVTIIERFIRGVVTVDDVKEHFTTLIDGILYGLVFLIVALINILTWPLMIIAEVYNIANEQ